MFVICCILSSCLVVFVSPAFLGNYKLVLGVVVVIFVA